MKKLKLIPEKTDINFIGTRKIAFFLSTILLLASVFLLATKGLNFGIDFKGGSVIEYKTDDEIDLSIMRKALMSANLGEVSIQNADGANSAMIRVGAGQGGAKERAKIINIVKEIITKNNTGTIEFRKSEFVGPQVGSELIQDGILSLVFALIGILVYIWMRFEWQFGVGAVVALFHDVILTLGLFSLLGLEFNLTSIAAILTIIGYSINDSVVIYDRIRDNLRKFKKKPITDLINLSINQTLSRTVLTAGTTIAALIALVTLGGSVIYGFSLSVLFGVIVGTYSSVYIASPILVYMNPRGNEEPTPLAKKNKAQKKSRA